MKDRTNEEGIDLATDKPTDNARRRGELESRSEGKHGAPQERNMIEEILEPERPKGSDSDIHSMRSHPAQTKSEPRQSVETREGEQGCSGDRRHDRRGLSRVREGALAEDCHSDQKRNLPPRARAQGVHSETRRDTAPVGDTDGA